VSSAAQSIPQRSGQSSAAIASAGIRVPIIALCIACFALFFGWTQLSPILIESCSILPSVSNHCAPGINKIRIYAFSMALFPLILLLERWRPADPDQSSFSPGLITDAWWFLAFPVLGVWLPTVFEEYLKRVSAPVLNGLQLEFVGALPVLAQLAVVVLIADLLAYVSHVIRHKVRFFWEFHKIHHSQQQLNYFSSLRLHPLDLIANSVLRFLPFTLLGLEMAVPAFIGWIAFQRFFEMFVHANLRANLGWLRFVLVTPQSHRIHHSLQHSHVDTNFGNIFSIWDFLFRTQVQDCQVYPATGVGDRTVPVNRSARLFDGAHTFLQELIHPLLVLAGLKR
jgi:sterol desaturase/sphingolipid hydroxylase (fatty acid hydroxylase superfamily)